MTRLGQLWLAAADINPALPWMLLPVLVWLLTWGFRHQWPRLWEALALAGPLGGAASKAWQAIPSTLLGAALAASVLGVAPGDLVLAGVVSVAAPVWHELLKFVTARVPWLPNYYGGSWPAAGGAPLTSSTPVVAPLVPSTAPIDRPVGPTAPPTSEKAEGPKPDRPSVG